MKKYIPMLFVVLFISVSAQSISTDNLPQRIILNLTEKPYEKIAVTWRTNNKHTNSEIQYAEATSWISFKGKVITKHANEELLNLGEGEIVYHYSSIVNGLKPNTKYLYRVGHDSVWSEWNMFKTAEEKNTPFKFVYFGDPQNDIKEHCSRVFREAYKTAPDANFWLFAGDIASDPYDNLWGELFDAAGFIFRVTPSILIPGNHDHTPIIVDGKKARSKIISRTWLAHFTHPENGPESFKETTYYLDYQGTRFIMINSHDKVQEQSVWLEKVLSNNPNRWTIVTFHVPVYSMAKDRDSKVTREAFMPMFDKYGVDLVLTGHDHTYARSKKIFNGKSVDDDAKGTVYIVSVSGPKMYILNSQYNDLMNKIGGETQLFQVIEVDNSKLKYKSYTAEGSLFDSCEIVK